MSIRKTLWWCVVGLLSISWSSIFANGGFQTAYTGKSDVGESKQIQVTTSKISVATKYQVISDSEAAVRDIVKAGSSVQANIKRIAARHGWNNVVWKSSNDYYWRGTTTISGKSLEDVMQQILNGYPLQAVFYGDNHVLVILPRTLK